MNLNLFPLCLALAGILIASTLQAQHAKSIPTDISDDIVSGVSFELATQRKSAISEVEYDLSFDLSEKTEPIPASISIRFVLANTDNSIVLDFNAPKTNVQSVSLTTFDETDKPEQPKQETAYLIEKGHIILPASELKAGKHEIKIQFIAGDQSLNRNDNFLYTLLVPDRAATVFPCFDQPDMKARFRLSLTLPVDWIASANGEQQQVRTIDETSREIVYKQTQPISTYLFAFVAGEFQTVTREINGRSVTMLHRESDKEKVERNLDAIFKTHEFALSWMEDYTGIEYPFDKFDFVVIPSFQYGGMEHIGNIFYNADRLFLDESATKNQKLNRASLIAHETAHMWFGNLVTMKWFDDVWLKEVFANFMAAKIVHPSFPDINHDLGFMLKHHPSAYGEDRSQGTYPIQQKLENLKDAGTLYGRIIYMKAPIVMRQLETMIGQKAMQNGLREYLNQFRYDNAVWDDLINILDRDSDIDLKQWSNTWVKEAGTPESKTEIVASETDAKVLKIQQTRTSANKQFWSQQIDVKVVASNKTVFETRQMLEGEVTTIELPAEIGDYDFYLANGSELGYGYFRLDPKSQKFLLQGVQSISDDVTRGAAWMALYESFLRGGEANEIRAGEFMNALISGLKTETEPLNRQNILSMVSTVYWKFMPASERVSFEKQIEDELWRQIDSKETKMDARAAYYKTLVNICSTEGAISRLYTIWESESDVAGLPLSENDMITLAYELALRKPQSCETILKQQLARITNTDRKQRFQFVSPALSPDQATRDRFFESLAKTENRRPERWALDGLNYLHHPLRAEQSEKYILPSLELLEEIQTTGDIFFPKRWLVATFHGHRSGSAAAIVTKFLDERPNYPYRLRNKILQAADLLLKSAQ